MQTWRTSERWRHGITAILAGVVWSATWPPTAWALRLETSRELLAVEIVAAGLQGPSGMASDPVYGDLYVAERGANRISLIRDKQCISIVEGPFDLIMPKHGGPVESVLTAPSDIAFDAEGKLYVVESDGPARLLCFEPLYDGLRQATEVATPWYQVPQVCTSIAVDRDVRLFVTTQNYKRRVITVFGAVMMRDVKGNWRLVDFGPFAEFSNAAVGPDGRTLVVGERRKADLSWYDIHRQVEMRNLEKVEGLRHVALLPDGTTMTSLHRSDGTWSLVEVDGLSGIIWEWIGGLGEIAGLFVHPQTGDLYLTLAAEGTIMRVRRLESRESGQPGENQTVRMIRAFELNNAIPPPEWPEFFRAFIERLGLVRAVNRYEPRAPSANPSAGVPLTIEEFASTVPVVAVKVRARLVSPAALEPDPVEELSFLLFNPNSSMQMRRTTAPSLSLFWARHRSGRISRTRFLPNKYGQVLDESLAWEELPEMIVSFPAGFYAPETGVSDDGLLRVYFLGMGMGPDYWIDLYREDVTKSHMLVERPDGQRVDYLLEPYLESPACGGYTVLVAGLKKVDMGWHDLGQEPIIWKIVYPESPLVQTRHMVDAAALCHEPLPAEAVLADTYTPRPAMPRIDLSCRIVLRAASRWSTKAF